MLKVVGNLLGVGLFLAPFIFILSQCTGESEKPSQAEIEKQAAEEAERRTYGMHCLSGWDGSHPKVVEAVKRGLRDPDSFEHIETRTSPVDGRGQNTLMMQFRARNGFGGTNVGLAKATLDNRACTVTIMQIED